MRGPRADARPKSLMHVRAGATFSLKCAADQEHRVDAGITKTVVRPLIAEQLYRPTDLSNLAFSTTAELLPIDGLIGQTLRLTRSDLGREWAASVSISS